MAKAKTLGRLAGGAVAAGLILFACGSTDAHAAKRSRSRSNGPLTVQTINVAGASGVAANEVIEVVFSTPVKATTVNEAVFQIREENATGTGFTKCAAPKPETSALRRDLSCRCWRARPGRQARRQVRQMAGYSGSSIRLRLSTAACRFPMVCGSTVSMQTALSSFVRSASGMRSGAPGRRPDAAILPR